MYRGLELKPGSVLLSHGESPALSSALSVFTSEFEMDSGGSHSLWPPGKLVNRVAECAEYVA